VRHTGSLSARPAQQKSAIFPVEQDTCDSGACLVSILRRYPPDYLIRVSPTSRFFPLAKATLLHSGRRFDVQHAPQQIRFWGSGTASTPGNSGLMEGT